ncbi:MAG: hypothetical protein WCP39_03885 [Chlamydiota bacterium]
MVAHINNTLFDLSRLPSVQKDMQKFCAPFVGNQIFSTCIRENHAIHVKDPAGKEIFSFCKGKIYHDRHLFSISPAKAHYVKKMFQKVYEYKENIEHSVFHQKRWNRGQAAYKELESLQHKFSVSSPFIGSSDVGTQVGDVVGITRNALAFFRGVAKFIVGLRFINGLLGVLFGPVGIVKGILALIVALRVKDKAGQWEAIHKIIDGIVTLIVGCLWVAIAVFSVVCPGAAIGSAFALVLFYVFFPVSSGLSLTKDSCKIIQFRAFLKKMEEYSKLTDPKEKYLGLANFFYRQMTLSDLELNRLSSKPDTEERKTKKLMRKETRLLRVTSPEVVKEIQRQIPLILPLFSTNEPEAIRQMQILTETIWKTVKKNQISSTFAVGLDVTCTVGTLLGVPVECLSGFAGDLFSRIGDVLWLVVNGFGFVLDNPFLSGKVTEFCYKHSSGVK